MEFDLFAAMEHHCIIISYTVIFTSFPKISASGFLGESVENDTNECVLKHSIQTDGGLFEL